MATFLIISPEPWAAHAVSKHHYAITLASRGHEVLFLSPPTTGAELAISPEAHVPRLHLVDGPAVARGLRYMPGAVRRYLEARWLDQLELRSNLRIDAIWLFENSRFFDMSFAGDRLKIYHQVDLNQHFHPHDAARSADICFCTTDIIRQELLTVSPRVHKIHHGTPVVPAPPPLTAVQRQRFRHGRCNAAYIGNLAMRYLDVGLLLATVKEHPDVCFHFIGGCSEDAPLRVHGRHLPNITWWGRQPSALLPSLLAEVDVVMCTYQAAHYRDQASPHKFMEYLASGNTIVSTYTDEYKDKRDLLCMVDESRDYIPLFGEVVANLPVYNSPARRERRKAFAATHSYDAQLDRIADLVGQVAPRHAALFRTAATADIVESVS